ncbi:UvrD-helicase domain-containing protein [bacterium SCSIO 12643]|nr:UvrD-helicase domain-containing protein [bacterium SCSIO 12643]
MGFLVYKSSAGSGKTFTLVKEYLKIALGSDDPKVFARILAITFTNKAANEMTDRILETLEEMGGVSQQVQKRTLDLMQILIRELDVSEEVLKKRARNTLKKIVHNYSDFSVGTIDSFVHKIIRSFAQEMGLNQQFDVELNTDSVLHRAVDMMLERVGIDKVLTTFIEQYANQKFEKGSSWKIDEDLFGFSKQLLNTHEWYYLNQAKEIDLETYLERYNELKKSVHIYEQYLRKRAKEAVGIALNNIEKNKYAYAGQFVGFFQKILQKDYGPSVGKNMQTLLDNPDKKWYATKASVDEQGIIEERKGDLIRLYLEIEAYRSENESEYELNKLLHSNLYQVALLAEIDKEVQKIKQENDLVLISDFTELVGQVTRTEPVPFIYEKLGEKYAHFLFDEFQDTSLMQWHNMLPLVENSLSQGGTSLVVGDAKQSIYRWRGGVVEQFTELPKAYNPYDDKYVKERELSLIHNYEDRAPLNRNFRSNADIVRFNNQFFDKAITQLNSGIAEYYADVAQEVKDENSQGYVEFNFYHDLKKEEASALVFEDITNLIRDLQKDGYALKDMAILTKKKNDTPALVEHLNHKEINVISSESLLVNNAQSVKLVSAVLKHLNQPGEKFYMYEILIRFNEIKLRPDFHQVIGERSEMNMLKLTSVLLGWGIEFNRMSILSFPLYEMVSEVLQVFGLDQTKDNRLATWMDYVYKISLKSGKGLYDLLDDWEEVQTKLSIQIPEDIDAVNVLTIHKSKGLDWPVVIIAEGNWNSKHNKHSFWVEFPKADPIPVAILPHTVKLEKTIFSKDYECENEKIELDNLNAMYVAFTRPSERLYVMSVKPNADFFKPMYSIIEDWEDDLFQKEYNETGKKVLSKFSYGTKALKTSEHKAKNAEVLKIENYKNSAYRDKLKVKKNYVKWMNDTGERAYGNLIHKAFSYIDSVEDLTEAVLKLEMEGDIKPDEKEVIEGKLSEVIQHPQVSEFFKWGVQVKKEAEIILSNGDLLRPDRVVIEDEQAIVIDFKTGMKKTDHHAQITSYKNQLIGMGYQDVRAVLIYVDPVEVVEL